MRSALDPEFEPEARVERLDHALDHLVPSGDDARNAPALGRELLAGGQVHARDLEELDVGEARVDARSRCLHEARDDRRAEDRLVGGHRARQSDRVRVGIGGDETPRIGLREPGADQRVLDDAPEPLLLRQSAADVAPQRQRVRDPVE